MVEDRLKPTKATKSLGLVIVFVSIISNFQIIHCGPSPQQEHELLLLDALSRKQISNSLNSISTNNYESNAIMDMLGRSMLFYRDRIQNRFELSLSLNYRIHTVIFVSAVCFNDRLISVRRRMESQHHVKESTRNFVLQKRVKKWVTKWKIFIFFLYLFALIHPWHFAVCETYFLVVLAYKERSSFFLWDELIWGRFCNLCHTFNRNWRIHDSFGKAASLRMQQVLSNKTTWLTSFKNAPNHFQISMQSTKRKSLLLSFFFHCARCAGNLTHHNTSNFTLDLICEAWSFYVIRFSLLRNLSLAASTTDKRTFSNFLLSQIFLSSFHSQSYRKRAATKARNMSVDFRFLAS